MTFFKKIRGAGEEGICCGKMNRPQSGNDEGSVMSWKDRHGVGGVGILWKIAYLHDGTGHLFSNRLMLMGAIGLKLQELVFSDLGIFALNGNPELALEHKDMFIHIAFVGFPPENRTRIDFHIIGLKGLLGLERDQGVKAIVLRFPCHGC